MIKKEKTDECNSKTGSDGSKSNRRAKQAENRARRQEKGQGKDVVAKEKVNKESVKTSVDKPKLASEIIAYSKKLDAADQNASRVHQRPMSRKGDIHGSKVSAHAKIIRQRGRSGSVVRLSYLSMNGSLKSSIELTATS